MSVIVSSQRDVTGRPDRYVVKWGIGCTPRELAPDWADPADPLVGCTRNGGPVKDWDALLTDGDHVHYYVRPAIPIVVGSAALAAFGNAVLFGIYAYLIQRVLFPAKKPVTPGDETSPTYAWSAQTRNAREEGTPIPAVYGQHLITPPCINEYTRSSIDANGNPVSEYLGLYLIGEGPISKVGDKTSDGGPFSTEAGNALAGLEINGQPARNFSGVEAHVRLGNLDQTAISEFAEPVLSFSVDKTLRDTQLPAESPTGLTHATSATDTPSATTAIATAGSGGGVGDPAGTNVTKWNTAGPNGVAAQETYTSGDDADEFTVIFEFPSGLIKFDNTGASLSNFVISQIRYRQVDGGGTPFGDYVVLPAEQRTLTRQGLLRLESRHKFIDPADYAPPNFGFYAISRSAAQANPGIGYAAVAAAFSPAAPATLQFSFSTWIRRRNAQAVSTTNRLFQWTGTNTGFRLNLSRGAVSSLGPSLDFIVGNGTSFSTISTLIPSSTVGPSSALQSTTTWHQLVVTYEASAVGSLTRVRCYFDGTLIKSANSATQAQLDGTAAIRLMSDSAGAPTAGYDGLMDETTLWSRALTPYEVASIYNGGAPIGVDAAADSLIIGARFDILTGNDTPAFGPFAAIGTNWVLGSGANAAADPDISTAGDPDGGLGLVKTPESGTPLRGKYLVEALRLDLEDVSQLAFSEMVWRSIQLRTFQDYQYPGMALLAVKIPANDQLSGGAPVVKQRVDGRLVPVWDGQNAVYPNLVPTYSRNPAWVALDAAMNKDFGLGAVYSKASDIDVTQFQAAATLWDTLIYDNLGRFEFSQAAYRDTSEEAVLGPLYGDTVRYQMATIPDYLPDGGATTGHYFKPILAGLAPSPPAWFTTQAGLVAQEIVHVNHTGSVYQVFTRTTQALGAGQTIYTVTSGQTEDNGLEGHDVRARFDGVFDRADFPAWDAILQILQTARASPLRLGSRLSLFYDDVASPVALVTMGNMTAGSWRQGFMGIGDRPNAERSDIFDESLDWERTPISDEHPDITDPASAGSFRWRSIRLEGITRRSQAKRYLRRDLNIYNLVRRWCEFEVSTDGIPIGAGDVLSVSHDVPQFGFSGRISFDCTNTTVKLDRPMVLAAATSYQVQVRDTSSGSRYTVAVTQAAGSYAAGSALTTAAFPASFAPAADDLYAIGTVAQGETKKYRVVERTFIPARFATRFRCLEYDPQVYDDDFGALPVGTSSALLVPGVPVVPPGVENLSVSEQTSRGPDGHIRLAAQVSFSHFPETYSAVGGSDVYVSIGDHTTGIAGAELVARLDAASTTVTVQYPFAREETYTVWVIARARDGSTNYRSFATWQEFIPSGLAPVPLPPENVRAVIAGDKVVYSWDDPGDGDHGAIVEARQGGWLMGVPLFVAPSQGRHSPPLPAWGSSPTNDAGVAEPPIYFRTKLRTGQYSDVAVLEFTPEVVSADGTALESSEENNVWGTA